MSLEETLGTVIGALQSAGVDYMLTGSIAASYHGIPRSTQDIDLVVEGSQDRLLRFAEALAGEGFYVSEDAVREAAQHRGQFNVIDGSSAWKVDLIIRKDRDFSRVEFGRRRRAEALGHSLWIATAEDVILAKLEWAKSTGSERQMEDVLGIVRSQEGALDEEYLADWVKDLGVEDQWQKARRQWK